MKTISLLLPLAALVLFGAGCDHTALKPGYATFIDVHEFGPGKVTAADVAKAHKADLATQGRHDVRFVDYWVDAEHGRVYCLSEAKNAASVIATHREAHGLLPAQIHAVSATHAALPTPSPEHPLFLDEHDFGPGQVKADAVAGAHEKDLAVQAQFGVRFVDYWVDEREGKVFCLAEAPNAEAVRATHRQAHGLLPTTIVPVTDGR
ncbi:DUF4242 domain-containing protein [Opitutus terrae]|uniref:DUF4242 domain-containing protein n=1 Tax=Opitutus terrae (strain DSM 11246 / JCM 15787 / PB90-1) TaxID=452637 RepID=B1ZTA7_OPITP|nr:DUF4242 domain-containing protein [Opitutus terrae]ACB76561.1 hypothetical protein Oter_3282 [Opitutus terrae PB90-1]